MKILFCTQKFTLIYWSFILIRSIKLLPVQISAILLKSKKEIILVSISSRYLCMDGYRDCHDFSLQLYDLNKDKKKEETLGK